ncbi:MAG: twin-arginine translocase TatA/TatE family subunit [Thermoanaerobaculia bacterium]|nr:twin-arginine translocase TatA/TatE family subunit [Thermoanaerobaculia bacterium]
MGNLGMPEIMMIMFLALLLFGPKKLPEIGKQVGKALGEFKRASNDLKRSIEDEMEKANISADLKLKDDPPKTDQNPASPAPVLAEGAVFQEKSAPEKPVEATKPS